MILEFKCVSGGKHPVIGDVWHRFPRCFAAGGERYDHYLCSALFMTMHTPEDCAKAIELLDLVQDGESTEEQFGLNDTRVKFGKSGAQVDILIEDEIEKSEGRFELAEFRKAICAWQEFLCKPEASEYVHEVDIS
jgi:hypothetical protein